MLPHTPTQLDFNVKFPLLRLLQFLTVLKSTINFYATIIIVKQSLLHITYTNIKSQ